MPDTILISELYGPVLQGEGALAGKVSHFIRTSGCGYRCSWCDSMHAVDPDRIKASSKHMSVVKIVDKILKLPAKAPWVTISGGDPVAWDLHDLVLRLKLYSFKVAVETQGQLWDDWLEYTNLVTCSPKPPSSGMDRKLDIAILQKYAVRLGDRLVLKIVAFDDLDLNFIERIHRVFPNIPLYITSGTPQISDDVRLETIEGYRKISESVLRRPTLRDSVVLCQQHVLLYGRELGR